MSKRETRYLVTKYTDIVKYLFEAEQLQYLELAKKVDQGREIATGKGMIEAVVVESDWPMYDDVWATVLAYAETGEYTTVPQGVLTTAVNKLTKETFGKVLTYQLKLQNALRRTEQSGSDVAIDAAKIRCQVIHNLIEELASS